MISFFAQKHSKIVIKCHYETIENSFVFNIYLIVLKPAFNLTYKQKKQVEKYI